MVFSFISLSNTRNLISCFGCIHAGRALTSGLLNYAGDHIDLRHFSRQSSTKFGVLVVGTPTTLASRLLKYVLEFSYTIVE
jgi:hypothetical protein